MEINWHLVRILSRPLPSLTLSPVLSTGIQPPPPWSLHRCHELQSCKWYLLVSFFTGELTWRGHILKTCHSELAGLIWSGSLSSDITVARVFFRTPRSFVEKWGWRNRSLLLGEHSQGKFSIYLIPLMVRPHLSSLESKPISQNTWKYEFIKRVVSVCWSLRLQTYVKTIMTPPTCKCIVNLTFRFMRDM